MDGRSRRALLPETWGTRRSFLAGATASVAAASLGLAACGDDGDDGAGPGDGGDGPGESALSVARFFGPLPGGGSVRVPFGLSDDVGLLPVPDTPGAVSVTVLDPNGDTVASELVAERHDQGLPRPFFAVEVEAAAAGFYDLLVDVDDGRIFSQFQVVGRDEAPLASLLHPGDQMPQFETPTVTDARGVTPICTREPECPLHDRTLSEVVGQRPVALLVSTPAFCQTAICGPIVDLFVEQADAFPDIECIHAEVYRSPADNSVPPVEADFAPIVSELGLPYEPALFTVDASGRIQARLDFIFDSSDIMSAMQALVS